MAAGQTATHNLTMPAELYPLNSAYFLRVFTDISGHYGDMASVVIDEEGRLDNNKRINLAKKLATGETIFINSIAQADISVIHPQGEIDFAGVGALAAAWLLTKLRRKPVKTMRARGKLIRVRHDAGLTWVQANLSSMPAWNYMKLDSPEAVERITVDATTTLEHTMIWAWINEASGLIRARTFAADWEILEAEGNGSGSMLLAAKLNRSLEIRHGQGSDIFSRTEVASQASLGGRVVLDWEKSSIWQQPPFSDSPTP